MKRQVIVASILLLFLAITIAPHLARAQGCSLCTRTAEQLDEKGAKGLNAGIVYLAALPLALMGTIGLVWWRRNKDM